MARTVADLMIERLIGWGVQVIFGLPGDGINGLFEALRTHQEHIRFIQVRHEEAAALAACGYAKYTGRLGVCLATSGPGGIHLLNGLYDAKLDGQPVLAITGHTFHDLIGTNYQQDVDLDKLFIDVAAYNQRVMGPAHVVNVVDEAIKVALARRTVVHLTIPKDVQDWSETEASRSPQNIAQHSGNVFAPAWPLPARPLLDVAAALLNAGTRVAILAGQGCLQAQDEVLALAEHLGAPIVKALLGKAVVPDDSPYTTGGIGLLGTAPSQDVLQECDTLLIAGSSFPYLEFYPKPGQARTIQIDLDPARIGLRYPVDVGLVGDCREVLQALLPLLTRKTDRRFLSSAQERMQRWRDLLREQAMGTDVPLKPQVIMYHVDKLLADNAIIALDSGTITTWAARYLNMRDGMQFAVSGTLATMACGVPYSLGAAVAYPHRQVVCVVGDGGFAMLLGEVATLVKYNLPVKIIVFKNNVLGMIKWEQMALEGNPEFGVALPPIDFATCARACGAAGYSIEKPAEVETILRQAFAYPGPAVIEALVDPTEPPLPGHVTTEQAWNVAKALARGQEDRWDILGTLVKNTVRQVI
ncbi:MAG: thiamine pyrophosphate-dependent enzyme [Candidatus Tectimicrobiota bacterium]